MQHEKVIIAPPDKLQTVKGKTLADKYFFTYAECRSPSMAAEIVRRYNAFDEMLAFIERVEKGQFGELKSDFISNRRMEAKTILKSLK